jgi:hypothetical protein
VAWYRAQGFSAENAATYAANWRRSQARQRSSRSYGHRNGGYSTGDSAHARKVGSGAYRAGRAAGDTVGLDPQVTTQSHRRITKR